MLMVARYLGLHGNVKIIVREELKSVPLLGWILQLVEYPSITESWSRCRTDLLSLLRSFTADAFPVLLFQFPEGDRIDSNIRQQSMSFAQKERRPQLLHVLLPRTTGFNTCIEALRCVQSRVQTTATCSLYVGGRGLLSAEGRLADSCSLPP